MKYIYALCEPGTRTIRYIGVSVNPTERRRHHLYLSRTGRSSPLWDWLRSLSNKPSIILLHKTSETLCQDDERLFIRNAKMLGMNLVNSTEGGDGCTTLTPEACFKISDALKGMPKTPAHRAAIGAALKGRTREPFSPEWRAALSAASKGVPKTPAHRAAIGAALRARKLAAKRIATEIHADNTLTSLAVGGIFCQ